jgi:hypothetical protein
VTGKRETKCITKHTKFNVSGRSKPKHPGASLFIYSSNIFSAMITKLKLSNGLQIGAFFE